MEVTKHSSLRNACHEVVLARVCRSPQVTPKRAPSAHSDLNT
jgi:hypothetical protein